MFVDFNILNQLGSPSINSNTFANRPAAGQTGRLFVSTDTFEIYRDNGTTWDLIGGPGSSTITGTGTATQVAYFTSSQAIGSSANLFWDNTSGFLGVATATPTARVEAVKTDGVGIYANFTTNAGSGSSTTALWAKNVTNSSGYAAVIEESTPNTTAGQYPLLVKHSLSSGTAGIGMGTGLQFQLPDDAGTFKTTQLTIETTDAAAATYKTRYRFNVQNNGSSLPVAYINATGLGIFTATPGAALDIHSTGVIAQLNTTSATGNTYLSFQRTNTGVWRIGDTYNSGANFFGLFNNSISTNAIAVLAATNKTEFTAVETYTTGLARGNYFDYNLSISAGGSFSSPNAITALGASLDLTLAGSATIPSGARSGLDAYNSIGFTGAGTLTHTQGTQIRAYSNITAGWAFNGTATGTITHLAGLRALFPDNTGSAVTVTNNYALLLNDQTANTGTVTYTNRWGVYQEGASDLNYMAANLLLGSTTNSGEKLQVTGNALINANTGALSSDILTVRGGGGSGSFGFKVEANNGADIFYTDHFTYNVIMGTTGGLVGIGTSTPTSKLHISGNSPISTDIGFTGGIGTGTEYASLRFRADAYNWTSAEIRGVATNGGVNLGVMQFFTSDVERMRITSAGLVNVLSDSTNSTFTSGGTLALKNAASEPYLSFHNNTGGRIGYLQMQTSGTAYLALDVNQALDFYTSGLPRTRLTGGGNFLIGTTTDSGRKLQVNGNITCNTIEQSQQNATAIVTLEGNYNAQGGANNYKIVRHYPVVSLGTKLIIPFVSQGNLNSTTICKIYGHSAVYNSNVPYGFEITFAVGHLNTLINLGSWGGNGNYASIAINGMNIEITFTNGYTGATANGIFVTIEYMTNVPSYSIDVANIAMN